MTGEDSLPRRNLMPLACLVFAAWIAAAIFSSRCLYADGSHNFIRILQTQNFIAVAWARQFACYLYEWPLVLGIKLGVINLAWLRFLFGMGCFLPWPLALICCHWVSPRHFWLAATGCAAGYLNAAFMAAGEHIFAHALFWPALFIILFARPVKPSTDATLVAIATAMLFSYESQLFLSTVLGALAIARAWDERRTNTGRTWVVFLVAAALFFAGVTVALCAVLMPENPGEFSSFKSGSLGIWKHTGWTLDWTLAWVVIALGVSFSEKLSRVIFSKAGGYLLFVAVLVWGAWPLLAPGQLDNGLQFDNRSLNLLVPLMLTTVALLLHFRPQWHGTRERRLKQLAAVLLLAQSLWQISATANWYRDVVLMQETLATRRGIMPLRSTVLAADGMQGRELHKDGIGGRYDWTWPCLSVALSPKPQVNCIICSEVFLNTRVRQHYWQPFDPLKPETLPDLRHYHIDFAGYVDALNSQLQQPTGH